MIDTMPDQVECKHNNSRNCLCSFCKKSFCGDCSPPESIWPPVAMVQFFNVGKHRTSCPSCARTVRPDLDAAHREFEQAFSESAKQYLRRVAEIDVNMSACGPF